MPDVFAGTAAEPLAHRLGAIRARYPEAEPEWVAEVVRAVVASLGGDPSPRQIVLLRELEELGRTIANAKAEIAALHVDDITAAHIPFATDELDAIVAHTASATDAILESCETLDAVGETLAGEVAARLQDATTRIYEFVQLPGHYRAADQQGGDHAADDRDESGAHSGGVRL